MKVLGSLANRTPAIISINNLGDIKHSQFLLNWFPGENNIARFLKRFRGWIQICVQNKISIWIRNCFVILNLDPDLDPDLQSWALAFLVFAHLSGTLSCSFWALTCVLLYSHSCSPPLFFYTCNSGSVFLSCSWFPFALLVSFCAHECIAINEKYNFICLPQSQNNCIEFTCRFRKHCSAVWRFSCERKLSQDFLYVWHWPSISCPPPHHLSAYMSG